MSDLDIAGALLAGEVKKKVRERGLVVWLDAERQYSSFVDGLRAGAHGFAYPVHSYRGSFLELMLDLENVGSGLHPEHVLVHLPGLNKDTVKETPIYELYKAGVLFERSLATLVREAAIGLAKPDEIEAFLKAPGLSLEAADAWLAARKDVPQGPAAEQLAAFEPDEVVLGLVTGDRRVTRVADAQPEAVLDLLARATGLSEAWRTFRFDAAKLDETKLASLVASWLMAVEFVDDLRTTPVMAELAPLKKLAAPFVRTCRTLAGKLRDIAPETYEEHARELEDVLSAERTSHHADVLGAIDTFRFEEATMRAAALAALARADWKTADTLARDRTPASCFWVRRSPHLQVTWELVGLAAEAGVAFEQTMSALAKVTSLEDATASYAAKLSRVDRLHRQFEQRAHKALASDLEDYDGLLEARGAVRRAYRAWSDAQNRTFFERCKAKGPLPNRPLRQRGIYDEVVHPLVAQASRVAFFMVDAMRYEMAEALAEELAKEKFQTQLSPRLAELPTDTRIGMNALAPVVGESGRLAMVLRDLTPGGFSMRSSFTVHDPATRVRAMSERSLGNAGGADDFELEDFQNLSAVELARRLRKTSRLVVVRSRELDDAGEVGLHLSTFEHTLALLRSSISLLAQVGVERFVITSDHGFLLQDATTEEVPIGATLRTATRRHALLGQPSGMQDVLEVPLSALEYDVPKEGYLVFRPDTAVWKTQGGRAPFVHGGNSLQERVIPVLVLEKKTTRGRTTSRYEVVARPAPAHLGRQRLVVAVRLQSRENASLGFVAPKGIRLAVRVPGRPDILVQLLAVSPPAELADGAVLVPPNRDEVQLEFELQGEEVGRERVEIYHPDGVEEVAPKLVEGFFEVAAPLGAPRARKSGSPPAEEVENAHVAVVVTAPAAMVAPVTAPAGAASRAASWAELIEDPGYRRALEMVESRGSINEAELAMVLGSPRRVRAFALYFDKVVMVLPFEIEVKTVNGMKAYVKKD